MSRVNILYLIWFLYLLFLSNLVSNLFKIKHFFSSEIDTKFNFYIKLIMIFLLKFTFLLNIFLKVIIILKLEQNF